MSLIFHRKCDDGTVLVEVGCGVKYEDCPNCKVPALIFCYIRVPENTPSAQMAEISRKPIAAANEFMCGKCGAVWVKENTEES